MRFILSLLLTAALLVAADFWDSKLYTGWSEQEVEKILDDSPWARSVEVQTAAMSAGSRVLRSHGGQPRAHSGDASRGSSGTDALRGRGPGAKDLQPTASMKVRLRWVSALPIRQAIARKRFGSEVKNSAEAAKMIVARQTAYVLGLSGIPKRQLEGDFGRLKERTRMKVKGREPIAPIHVQIVPGQPEVYVFFPKANQGGYDLTAEDGSVEIEIELESATLRRGFRLKDMLYHGKLQI